MKKLPPKREGEKGCVIDAIGKFQEK